VKLLLDTHVLLWALAEPDRLSDSARRALEGGEHELVVSAASVWEIAIKQSLGKLELPGPVDSWLLDAVEELDATWLAIEPADAAAVARLPDHHRDPFDRMLVAQAQRGFTLVTHDRRLSAYPISVLWA
jgi:PIN domain nuclease of toxin-antitoxin system